ncbi:MAG: DUF1800 domain-containing protein [Planctomycetes bacterium]|nr:DUF1800 domain-containing protein [Planctomycetota bacterium]
MWVPYAPHDKTPWDLRRVVHLHRRAGFAATWAELQRDLADGPGVSIDRLVKGNGRSQGVPDDFERIAGLLADAAVPSGDAARLKAWWIYRMLFSPDPLGERLTVMWHNHFATSNLKVRDLAAMRRQNEIFGEFARAPFGELLPRVVKDPAMLVWLDAQANRKGHPNENLAREIMEVFTLGVGNYTETDVKEAARSLTGWTVKNGEFREHDQSHDDGDKTIFGHTGRWRGDDLVRMLLEHPATSRRLAFRICELFMGEEAVTPDAFDQLADGLREHELNIGWAVETVLRSEAFCSDRNIGNRVRGPVEFVVGSVRALEMFDPPPSTLILAEWCAALGQDLFYPPNVFGWPGGRSWITSRSIIGRTNFASALVDGSLRSPASPVDGLGLAQKNGSVRELTDGIDFFSQLLLGQPATSELTERTLDNLRSQPAIDPATLRYVIASVLSSAEAQLG